ncbi:ATP-dependent nuclease [Citreimonas salinaria]|uniref:AAA domain-containing protein, putative AbiEii toxin, Type IV TA system n=1 Tax=Citreimonas salinaria TaxID=321339 RepID=A0A1H3HT84_9RHOB|nr:ATP-binding protein [Citreimonas salinaria]SDY18687.1 AAA domain-containing protein, putative AbiEii toxin, Type IV TA system [Citreimonas salinaria]
MEPALIINEIEFPDGGLLILKPGSIVVVTGPNNAGKSTFLREISSNFDPNRGRKKFSGRIAKRIDSKLIGSQKDFLDFFTESEKYDTEREAFIFTAPNGYSKNIYKRSTIKASVARGKLPAPVEASFKARLPAHERLGGSGYKDSVDSAADSFFSNEAGEIALSKIFEDSFGIGLFLDRTRKEGSFYLCDRKELPPHDQRLTPEFRKWVEKLLPLREQGDGMRSFARLLIEVFVRKHSIVLIDEPELFLHPPQIRQLARKLVQEKPENTQLIISTHSDDFVKGVLDNQPHDLNFIRLTRTAGETSVRSLQNSDVNELWADPLLRTSNALSSLFHQFTIVCEGETDARFLRWALDKTMTENSHIDYFIAHCGGKQKMRRIVSSIRPIGANILSFCDIDVLNDKTVFCELFTAHGGDYADVRKQHDLILKRTSERKAEISAHYFWSELDRIKQEYKQAQNVSAPMQKEISNLIRRSSPWGRIKEDGYAAFVDAASVNAFKEIEQKCSSLGLFINPTGELESLCRSLPRNKSAWLTQVLEKSIEDEDMIDAKRVVGQIANYMLERTKPTF